MFFMMIHINQTLQSHLVAEKNIIYFLKHAGATSGFGVVAWLHGTVFAARAARRVLAPATRGCHWPLTGLRHINRRLLPK